jgi:hypothetical protein
MKALLAVITLIIPLHAFADAKFIHPMDFNGSEQQKKNVIEIIKNRVNADYCQGAIDMCQPTTLRMMETQNLKAFKEASRANNRSIMDSVINDYCYGSIDMCNYTTILMMYKQNLTASKEKLAW